jgi:hypothetical protein
LVFALASRVERQIAEEAGVGKFASVAAVAVGCLVLAGCGIPQENVQTPKVPTRAEVLKQQSDAALKVCETKYPTINPKNAVASANCRRDALLISNELMGRHAPLFAALFDYNVELAERYQNGQITFVQWRSMSSQRGSEVMTEFQRQLNAENSVFAQQSAAMAQQSMANSIANAATANRSVTCTRYGDSVTCN